MNIVQVSARDVLGGAEQVARLLHEGYRKSGHGSWLVVGEKTGGDPDVLEIPRPAWRWLAGQAARGILPTGWYGERLARYISNPGAAQRALLGRDSFNYPASRHIAELAPKRPDILHFHNLHGSYFDLRALGHYAGAYPVVTTMHDAWLLTGGCTHPLACERFRESCGQCPHQKLYFRASLMDSTAGNLRRKREALTAKQNKYLHVVAPSQWLLEQLSGSILEPVLASSRVIPNGVDTEVFRPGDQPEARVELGFPPDAFVVMHASIGATRNVSKGFSTMQEAVAAVASRCRDRRVIFLVVGDSGSGHAGQRGPVDGVDFRFVARVDDARRMSLHYAAADVYLQGSVADTFPTTILEAMACGRPVVATQVGGIPEQVNEGVTGRLVRAGDAGAMGNRLHELYEYADQRMQMGRNAAEKAHASYGLATQIDAHLRLYEELASAVKRSGEGSPAHS